MQNKHIYEVRPHKDKRGVNLISYTLRFGGLWYAGVRSLKNARKYFPS